MASGESKRGWSRRAPATAFTRRFLPARRIVWARGLAPSTWNFTAGIKATPQLHDGPARLVIEATSNDFRGITASAIRDVTVVSRPPMLSVDSDQHYLYLGMADVVTFNVSGYVTDSGVRVGDSKFRSWPMPGGKPGLFALYAFPWNTPAGTAPLVYAANPTGAEVTGRVVAIFPPKEQPKYRVRDLVLDDNFVQKVVNELDPNGSGELIDRFVKINRDMRKANNKTLSDLRDKTEPRFLWSQPFLQEHNSAVEANFADVRNYVYHGRKVDQEVHLGYDLAITPHIGVEASNDGKVIYAAPLGIYGNCVVVDHGYGLQSIYGHMSEFAVHEGDVVKRGADARQKRFDRHGRRRPHSLHHATGRRSNRPEGILRQALDQGPRRQTRGLARLHGLIATPTTPRRSARE
jgi:murein DD-endopeptidase MepM/ murein hydrolase activator NlpD